MISFTPLWTRLIWCMTMTSNFVCSAVADIWFFVCIMSNSLCCPLRLVAILTLVTQCGVLRTSAVVCHTYRLLIREVFIDCLRDHGWSIQSPALDDFGILLFICHAFFLRSSWRCCLLSMIRFTSPSYSLWISGAITSAFADSCWWLRVPSSHSRVCIPLCAYARSVSTLK